MNVSFMEIYTYRKYITQVFSNPFHCWNKSVISQLIHLELFWDWIKDYAGKNLYIQEILSAEMALFIKPELNRLRVIQDWF